MKWLILTIPPQLKIKLFKLFRIKLFKLTFKKIHALRKVVKRSTREHKVDAATMDAQKEAAAHKEDDFDF